MEQLYPFKGLDLTRNQLSRKGDSARDCSNVKLGLDRNLTKRSAMVSNTIPLPTGRELVAVIPYNGKRIVVAFSPDAAVSYEGENELYCYDGTTLELIPNNSAEFIYRESNLVIPEIVPEGVTFSGNYSLFEEGNVLYIQFDQNIYNDGVIEKEGNPRLIKYDGLTWSEAGSPELKQRLSEATRNDFIYTWPQTLITYVPITFDNKGNQVLGVAATVESTGNAGTAENIGLEFVVDAAGTEDRVRFPQSTAAFKVGDIANQDTDTYDFDVPNGSTMTVPALAVACKAGQYVYYVKQGFTTGTVTSTSGIGSYGELTRFKIISTDTTTPGAFTVEIGEQSVFIGGEWILNQDVLPKYPFRSGYYASQRLFVIHADNLSATLLAVYKSQSLTVGHKFIGYMGLYPAAPANSGQIFFTTTNPPETSPSIINGDTLDSFYDILSPKGSPVPAIQVQEYNGVSLLVDENTLRFSDLGRSGTVENFTAFDFINIPEPERGKVTGFFANETFIVVFREREAFLITGNIFSSYRIQSYRSTRIGCVSPNSIIELEGQCLFMSQDGPKLAMENGDIGDIGENIESMFTEDVLGLDLDITTTFSAIDSENELVYMGIKSNIGRDIVLLFDYRYKEWFKYEGIGYKIFVENAKLFSSDGGSILEEDGSANVEAYWSSNFETSGKASYKKRFQRLHFFLTKKICDAIDIKTYKEWDTANLVTDVTMTPDKKISMDNHRLNPSLCHACSFDIISRSGDVLDIDAFEYAYTLEGEELVDESR